MQETPIMRQVDELLLRLDATAKGQVKALSDALAGAWEAHRAELGTYPPSNTVGVSIYAKERQPSAAKHL